MQKRRLWSSNRRRRLNTGNEIRQPRASEQQQNNFDWIFAVNDKKIEKELELFRWVIEDSPELGEVLEGSLEPEEDRDSFSQPRQHHVLHPQPCFTQGSTADQRPRLTSSLDLLPLFPGKDRRQPHLGVWPQPSARQVLPLHPGSKSQPRVSQPSLRESNEAQMWKEYGSSNNTVKRSKICR